MVLHFGKMESNMMSYTRLVIIFVCMAASGNPYAQSAADNAEAAPTQQAEPERRSPPAEQGPRPARKPAATFKPSEKIGADSAVSFPVDI